MLIAFLSLSSAAAAAAVAAIAAAAVAAIAAAAGVSLHGVSLVRRGGLPVPLLSSLTQQQLLHYCGVLTQGVSLGAPAEEAPYALIGGQLVSLNARGAPLL